MSGRMRSSLATLSAMKHGRMASAQPLRTVAICAVALVVIYDAEREVAGSFDANQIVWRDVKRTGSYVARTRMGVRATVRSSIEIEDNLDLSSTLGPRRPACLKGSYTFSYDAPVRRAEAPLLKARGYLVFMGRLVAPFIASNDSPGEPTLDNPHDVFERDLTGTSHRGLPRSSVRAASGHRPATLRPVKAFPQACDVPSMRWPAWITTSCARAATGAANWHSASSAPFRACAS